jgi:hypothetical protein
MKDIGIEGSSVLRMLFYGLCGPFQKPAQLREETPESAHIKVPSITLRTQLLGKVAFNPALMLR